MVTSDDHELAKELATATGGLLLALRQRLSNEGAPPAILRHEGDQEAHRFLTNALAKKRASDAILSEEGCAHACHPKRSSMERVWILDPLDGTREFGEQPRTDWAVHVALAIAGKPAAGAVALPGLGATFSTAKPPDVSGLPPTPESPRIVVSRSRPDSGVLEVIKSVGGRAVEMGSAGAKAMAVVRGDAEAYLHAGGQYEWDSCAPVAVALTAGLHASRIDGSPLIYNRPDPYLPDLLICRRDLAKQLLSALAAHL